MTVLFADVVGSTGVGERTDPESLRRVMTRYFDEMQTIVERHGGVVEKFIGDAVMAVFGVPVVHEDDALRAVRAAAEIRDRLAEVDAELVRDRGMSVGWRTGINTGEVVAGDTGSGQRFVTGDAVNVAARLEQAAQPGEILIGGDTWKLVRDAVSAEIVGPLELRGRSRAVEAHRLLDVEATAPARGGRLSGPMVGRQRPRRLLAGAFEQVSSDRVCHLFTVLGAAGVGKSRLAREALADIGERALVLRGRCLSYGEGITYWPIAEIVRQAAGLAESDDDDALRAKIGLLIDDDRDRPAAVQRLGEILGRLEGSSAQDETFWAVRTMIESQARRRPLVLVLDDLHWAAPTLLDLVEHLVDWTHDAPLLVLCLARQELLDARPGWGGGKPYATTVTLEPLSEAESHDLVTGLIGQVGLGGKLEAKIIATAEGNPLFVEEMVGMLIDGGQLTRRNGQWTADAGLADVAVPPTIHALLAARLDGLPEGERAMLERGSIEGKVFHRGAVAELAPDSLRADVGGHLRSLARKELVRPERGDFAGDEAFRFRHLLIRDAAYGALAKETRSDLHARFAGWLERVAADHVAEYEEILGYHYEQAFRYRTELGPADEEARRLGRLAAQRLGAAGQRALDRGDVAAATKLLTSAADLLPENDPVGVRLRADLGLAMAMGGDLRGADEMLASLIEVATAADDEHGAAYAQLMRLESQTSLSQVPVEQMATRSGELLAILDRYDDRRGADRATFELARHTFFAGRARLAGELLSARIARSEPGRAPGMLTQWLGATLLWGPTPVAEATQRLSQMLETAPTRSGEALALTTLGVLRAMVGEFDEGREFARRGIAIRHELGQSVMRLANLGNFLGPIEVLAKDYGEAKRVLSAAYAGLTETGERGFASTIAGQLADVEFRLGNLDEAERYALLAREMAPLDDVDAQARGLRALARVLAARGEFGAAREHGLRAVAIVEPTDYSQLRGDTFADLAEVRLAAGEQDAGIEALHRALATFEAKGATVLAGNVRRRLDELGQASA